jgi:hypothetical protein
MVLPDFTTRLNDASLKRTAGLVQRYGLTDEPVDVGQLTAGAGT